MLKLNKTGEYMQADINIYYGIYFFVGCRLIIQLNKPYSINGCNGCLLMQVFN